MEEVFKTLAEYVALTLEAISILVVAVGGLEAAYRSLWPMLRGHVSHGMRRAAWLGLARWLLLGLEFMLAADVVRTAITPDWQAIGQLGAIAVIRTFLNYFLERDLEAASHVQEAA
ncbi:DUF1622 domain-containing protein [Marilutibacter alkalisoli]|uniref:DUF1622 domain-containing protein n=1 Tax=Marilutibacter alkalisoli TaxID=2591633 RepID=A0A514BSR8_9GAMM|nr:DUF1622 domain-containing protein [Lysobacter alkalisoli]QDH70442.1 DUF1622 domain-containing protein [Lysobacter alkalisoli]